MISPITRKEIIAKYNITEGQISFAVNKRVFPKKKWKDLHGTWFYDANEIEEYFKNNPVKPSRILKKEERCSIRKKDLFQEKTNNFNKCAVMFNIQKREREKPKAPSCEKALINKYKKAKRKSIQIDDTHEQAELRQVNSFAHIHDSNHRIVI